MLYPQHCLIYIYFTFTEYDDKHLCYHKYNCSSFCSLLIILSLAGIDQTVVNCLPSSSLQLTCLWGYIWLLQNEFYTAVIMLCILTVQICFTFSRTAWACVLVDATYNLTHQYSGHSRSPSLPVISDADYQWTFATQCIAPLLFCLSLPLSAIVTLCLWEPTLF